MSLPPTYSEITTKLGDENDVIIIEKSPIVTPEQFKKTILQQIDTKLTKDFEILYVKHKNKKLECKKIFEKKQQILKDQYDCEIKSIDNLCNFEIENKIQERQNQLNQVLKLVNHQETTNYWVKFTNLFGLT